MSPKKNPEVTTRIYAVELRFCHINQRAYKSTINTMKKLAPMIDSTIKAQRTFLQETSLPENGGQHFLLYFDVCDGKQLSSEYLPKLLFKEHQRLILNIVVFFESTYQINLDVFEIKSELLPRDPRKNVRCSQEDIAAWEDAMIHLTLDYRDILEKIFEQTKGEDLAKKTMEELFRECKIATINDLTGQKKYVINGRIISFANSCYPDKWYRKPFDQYLFTIPKSMQSVMRAANIYSHQVRPLHPLFYPFDKLCESNIEGEKFYSPYNNSRIRAIRLYQNGRVDFAFANNEYALDFAAQYLENEE